MPTVQKAMDCREPSHNKYICITVPLSMAQDTPQMRKQTDC